MWKWKLCPIRDFLIFCELLKRFFEIGQMGLITRQPVKFGTFILIATFPHRVRFPIFGHGIVPDVNA